MNNEVKDFFNKISDNWTNEEDDINIINYLIHESGIKENERVLDVGCGKGVITPYLYNVTKREVIAIDIADKMIDGALNKYRGNPNYKFICGDFLDYQFDSLFDSVVIYNAYPHFLDVEKLRDKAYDVLDKGGKLIIMHSIGRKTLQKHHENVMNISRNIDEAEIEAMNFYPKFKLIKSVDKEDRYLIVLEKV